MKPRFVLGENELVFSRGIQYPIKKPNEKFQVIDRTAAGTIQVEDLGLGIRTRVLSFKNLPQADYDALTNWFDNVSDGAFNEFTYYDEDGESMLVKLVNSTLDFQEESFQRFSGELSMEVVG